MLTQRQVRVLVTVQSVLVFLQYVAGASILGDVITPKWAALFIVVVAGAQQAVNFYVSKSVSDAVTHVTNVVDRAEAVTGQAEDVTTRLATQLSEQPLRGTPHPPYAP
jgi:hypothetical protein